MMDGYFGDSTTSNAELSGELGGDEKRQEYGRSVGDRLHRSKVSVGRSF
jgi:hypothetical protein